MWPLPGVVPCFVLRFLYTCVHFVVTAREGSAALHVVSMFVLLPILSENTCRFGQHLKSIFMIKDGQQEGLND